MKTNWGFDTKHLDKKTAPQNDFYQYANGGWIATNTIPKTESRWGAFTMLRYKTEQQLHDIVTEVAKKTRATPGSPEQMIRDLYLSGMDMKTRARLGAQPLAPWLKKIHAIEDRKDLLTVIAELHRIGVGPLFGAYIDQDAKKSTRYLLHFYQDGLGLPDRDYYLKDDAESVRIRTAYVPHVEAMFRLLKRADAKSAAKTVVAIETKLAKISMNKVDRRDIDKTYNKKTVSALQKLSPSIDWKQYLKDTEGAGVREVIVMQPQFFAGISALLKAVSIEDWKTYLEWHVVSDFASALSLPFIKQSFAFYGTVLSGTKHMKPLWRRVLGSVNGNLGELLGELYVRKHFTEASKRKVNVLVDDLFEAYAARIKNLDWMSPATKKKALGKLHMMTRKIGYPNKWRSYKGLLIKADDYAGNLVRASLHEHKRQMKKLSKPVDRNEWFMYPQTVNAYNAPNLNDIAFPAAILQAPFFDTTADDAVNYGSIGTVIGHEITHGFDDEGAKFDGKGNLKSWWTAADKKRFKKKSQVLVSQFNQYEVAHGVKVNGQLTLGENIADLGGASIAFDALQNRLKKTGRKDIEGFSPEQRFFLGFAVFERELSRPEIEKLIALTDPHSPGKFRINGPASNLPEFYEAFGVTEKHALYRKPNQRAKIW
jgi:putative endopeptidase